MQDAVPDAVLAASACVPSPAQLLHDAVSGLYVTLTNPARDNLGMDQRNVLVLTVSKDLRSWRQIRTVLFDDTGLTCATAALVLSFYASEASSAF